VVGAERLRLGAFLVVAGGRDHRAADRLRDADRRRADARPRGLHQHRLAGQQLRIVEQHVLDRAEGDGGAGRVLEGDALRHLHQQAGGDVGDLPREAVDVEAGDARDLLAQVVAPSRQAGQTPQVRAP
jgi:hypothetical protein